MFSEISLSKSKSKRNVMIALLLLLIGLSDAHMAVQFAAGDDLYASPCPEIFNYFLQDGVLQYGVLKVDCPDDTTIQLHVELSVGNHVQGYNGDLVLGASREDTIQNILQRKPIMYRLNFPRWFNYPPKVTKVTLNGEQLCEGPAIDIKSVRILTTINLHHTLKLNFSPGEPGTPGLAGSWSAFPGRGLDPTMMIHYTSTQAPATIDFQPMLPPRFFYNGTRTIAPIALRSTTEQPPTVTFPPAPSEGTSPRPKEWSDRAGFQLNDDQCGITFNTNTLIANGRDVQQGQYPWLVAIFVIKSLGPEFLCGANLVSHKHVITAGHCMKQGTTALAPDKIFLRIGEHNIHKWTHVTGSRLVGADRVHVHDDYKTMSADGDIALIVLGDEVEFTKFIRPICLWRGDAALDHIVGQTGSVVGWGKDEHDNLITPEPKQIAFPVVSQEDCLRSHFTFREITSDRTFCAGYKNGSGPCNGDSGGGFIMEREGRWYLRGIVSMSIAKDRSCDFSQYFVFADVTKFLDWINSNR